MSMRETKNIASLPASQVGKKDFMTSSTIEANGDLKYYAGNKYYKSQSKVLNPNKNISDSPETKEEDSGQQRQAQDGPRHLRKTISSAGINARPNSKVVLRRWSSLIPTEEDVKKRHSSPIYEGSRGEKISFRPVSSILSNSPWAKDFKGSNKGVNEIDNSAKEGEKATSETPKGKGNLKKLNSWEKSTLGESSSDFASTQRLKDFKATNNGTNEVDKNPKEAVRASENTPLRIVGGYRPNSWAKSSSRNSKEFSPDKPTSLTSPALNTPKSTSLNNSTDRPNQLGIKPQGTVDDFGKQGQNRINDKQAVGRFSPDKSPSREGGLTPAGSHTAKSTNPYNPRDPPGIDIKRTIDGFVKQGQNKIGNQQISEHVAENVNKKDNKANYVLNNGATAIPQSDNYKVQSANYQNTDGGQNRVSEQDADLSGIEQEEMSYYSGGSYYSRKYSSDFAPSSTAYRRGNIGSTHTPHSRIGDIIDRSARGTDKSYTSAFKTATLDKSGRETVAEVNAYISAYKSRKERSFEYGEGGRSERKTSFDKLRETTPHTSFHSHATRSYSSSYTPTYHSLTSPSGELSDKSRPIETFRKTSDKDYGTGGSYRSKSYLPKTDRSKSFDAEPLPYSSFTRSGSGGRYPHRNITSAPPLGSSSTSSSRVYTPTEKSSQEKTLFTTHSHISDDYKGSILSSKALSPSERLFFSTSKFGTSDDVTSTERYRKSSLDHASSYTKTENSYQRRPQSLIGEYTSHTRIPASTSKERRTSLLSNEKDSLSRSRIMGGILSRFFTEEEPSVDGQTAPNVNQASSKLEESPQRRTTTHENPDSPADSLQSPLSPTKDEVFAAESDTKLELPNLPLREEEPKESPSHIPENFSPAGDSPDVVPTSPDMTSEGGVQAPSSNRQIVKVKSGFVEDKEPNMGKGKGEKSSQKGKGKGADSDQNKASKDSKDQEFSQLRERRSSWLGRSFRKISSASKTAPPEETHEKGEKTKSSERRKSLLRRLGGRDSKTTEAPEDGEKGSSKSEATSVVKSKSTEKLEKSKSSEKTSGEKKEEKGFASYLRRSGRRKKSQAPEKDIEGRQEAHVESHDKTIVQPIDDSGRKISRDHSKLSTAEQKQSSLTDLSHETAAQSSDEVNKERNIDELREGLAPIAKAEDSDDEMASVSSRGTSRAEGSRFAEVLRRKELAAKAENIKTDLPKKTDVKVATSYLSSKFMKSKTLFESTNDASEPKKDIASSRFGPRRHTQETKIEPSSETAKKEVAIVGRDRVRSTIDQKRAMFQRANTVGSGEISRVTSRVETRLEITRVPLKERNKVLTSTDKPAIRAEEDARRRPARRIASDPLGNSRMIGKRIVPEQVQDNKMLKNIEETKESKLDLDGDRRLNAIGEKKTEKPDAETRSTRTRTDSLETKRSALKIRANSFGSVRGDRNGEEPKERLTPRESLEKEDKVCMEGMKTEKQKIDLDRKQSADQKDEIIKDSNHELKNDKNDSKIKQNSETIEEKPPIDNNVEHLKIAQSLMKETESISEKRKDKILKVEEVKTLTKIDSLLSVEDRVATASDSAAEESDAKDQGSERAGSRRRRERRAHRAKQVDPLEIERVKEQMRRDSAVKGEDILGKKIEEPVTDKESTANTGEAKTVKSLEGEDVLAAKDEKLNLIKEIDDVSGKKNSVVADLKDKETSSLKEKVVLPLSNGTANPRTLLEKEEPISAVDGKPEQRLVDTDKETGDDSNESSNGGSATKLTTRSVIKDKIRQKKFDKQQRKERTMSLPIGVEVVITPPANKDVTEKAPVMNGTRSPLLTRKPPLVPPKVGRAQEADDISSLRKKAKRPPRARPKTLTQGIDPSLLLNDIKSKEDAVVVEEKLSIKQLKQRLLETEAYSGTRTPKTPEVQKKNKRRSGKRYKTITEGIAPGLLEAAHQVASGTKDPNMLGVEQMNRLNLALSASTENLKRRSFVVSEVNSRIGSVGASEATSVEDLSTKENGTDKPDIVEASIKKLKSLPMVVDSDDDDPMPSVSNLKQKFLQAVEDSYKPLKNTRRRKSAQRERPFTISGIDDATFKQLQIDIKERHDADNETSEIKFKQVEIKIEEPKENKGKLDDLGEEELENMMKSEGMTAEQLAAELGINPSLAQPSGSPLRSRKPFLGTTEEETAHEINEIEQKPEEAKPLGNLREKFMNAISDFKSNSFDKESNDAEEQEKEEKKKERKVGVVITPAEDVAADTAKEPLLNLDFVTENVTQLHSMTDRRHLKPQRKQRSVANPVKNLQSRDDLITEVPSNKTNEGKPAEKSVGQKLFGDKKWLNRKGRKVILAKEATAALQSTEDFSLVKLRKVKTPGKTGNGETVETGGVPESSVTNLLLRIKGRRHVQIHIAEFSTDSLTSNDSFVIVTPKDLLCWHGRHANVIEKAKASEIASRINQKKEMGCKAFDVVYFEQESQNEGKVFRTLGAEGKPTITDHTEDDEDYERNMMNTSMVYSLQDSDPPELVPVYDMCQRSPSKEILKTNEAYVFDFMSEVYVWIGRQTTSVLRKKIMKLAREQFDKGYYKPPSSITPHHHHGKSRKISLTATELPARKQSINRRVSVHKFVHDKENLAPRPSYAIFLSMFEGAEWVIFKEKFCDWPDESRIIRMKGGPQTVGELAKEVNMTDVKPVDPQTMMTPKSLPILPTFEGTEIDRGQGKPKGSEGYHIITRNVKVWHVTERSRTLLPLTSNGHFHSGEGYVIRWEYSIVASRVMKMLKDMEEAKASGRQRCAYFFWLGNDCSVTEQGATAVMTVDLDEERGPHVRVIQGKEPPCFLNLFDGGMIVHAGKRQSKIDRFTCSDRSVVRLYCIRSEIPNEAYLLQVPVSASSLRSRSSFVLVLCKQAEIFLWHGCKSSDATKATAIQAAHRLIENHPGEALLADKEEIYLTEIEEGHEPEVFWVALGGEDDYGSLLTDINNKWDFEPRCFHLTSATGQFIAHEITNPSINPKEKCPFPFLQDDLYDAYQPGIFIIDAIHEVYLWLGWWPEDEENENSDAQRMRWDVDKRKAMESVVLYCQEAGRSLSHTYVVDAGLEPEQFIHLFPYWIVQEDITDIQIEDGREDSDKPQLLTKKLEGFTREYFSIEELRQRPLPEGVNPSKLDSYLSDEDFQVVFHMSRSEFSKIPGWKQTNLKKRVGLY